MRVSGAPADQDPHCVDVQGDPRRRALLDTVVAAMDEAGIDVIIYPSWSNPPRHSGPLPRRSALPEGKVPQFLFH